MLLVCTCRALPKTVQFVGPHIIKVQAHVDRATVALGIFVVFFSCHLRDGRLLPT